MAWGWWKCKGDFKCQIGKDTGPGLREDQHFLFVFMVFNYFGFLSFY